MLLLSLQSRRAAEEAGEQQNRSASEQGPQVDQLKWTSYGSRAPALSQQDRESDAILSGTTRLIGTKRLSPTKSRCTFVSQLGKQEEARAIFKTLQGQERFSRFRSTSEYWVALARFEEECQNFAGTHAMLPFQTQSPRVLTTTQTTALESSPPLQR
jgi:hypothetical protein